MDVTAVNKIKVEDDIKYILATIADIPILLNMRKLLSHELAGALPAALEQELDERQVEYFTRELNKTYFSWHATINGDVGAIAGMVIREQPGNPKNPSGRWAYLMLVYTKPEYRKRGLSGNLVQRLLDTGKEMGITAFELHATPAGESVYISNGFSLYDEPTYRMII